MKNRLSALLIGIILLTTLTAGQQVSANAEEITGAQQVSAHAEEITENRQASARTVETTGDQQTDTIGEEITTGSQQRAIDNQVDVDEDIKEEVEELIPEEIEYIKISTAEDLSKLALDCRLDTWSVNKYVTLENDISLLGSDFVTIPTFSGYFDGKGHSIKEYYISQEESNIGLFAYLEESAVVKDLNLTGIIDATDESSVVGALCGHNEGVIQNCSFKGIVSGSDYIGGLVGINELSGIIADSTTEGSVMGQHFTGGIAGENMGNILRCTNSAEVNAEEKDVSLSLEDINLDKYVNLFSISGSSDSEEKEADEMALGIVDTGGIAGLSIGVIEHCSNEGSIGYEKLGYNVGGITGRQSGYVYDCHNTGCVLGRKDVGGITGQAEPYVTIDFSQDIVAQLSDNISKLHDIIAVTLNDTDQQSDTVSNRLSIIKAFTDMALEDTRYLSDNTITWTDGMVGAANDFVSRADYVMDEAARSDGVLDQTTKATENVKKAADELKETVNDLEIRQYFTEEQAETYDSDEAEFSERTRFYDQKMEEMESSYTNYYRDKRINSESITIEGTVYDYTAYYVERPRPEGYADPASWTYFDLYDAEDVYNKYKDVDSWQHFKYDSESAAYVSDAAYPDTEDGWKKELDSQIEDRLASEDSSTIAAKATAAAENSYTEKYGTVYTNDAEKYLGEMASILLDASDEMGEDTRKDAAETAEYVKNAAGNLESASNSTRSILNNLNERADITFPQLGGEFKAHTTSLVNSLQGMSDNFGLLNSEMNGATDVLTGDLSAVNDQFNVIMMLYTDAIDGVLDKDYSTVIEDDSISVAQTSVDATLDMCTNSGIVSGSINVSGIAGTMAIEYDYDLESDVTGIKDANMNTTYLTKCVLRKCCNRGRVTGQKSYVGGVCGLQEMGIILNCENYSKIKSDSGDYVGGIAGMSLSDIDASYAKCIIAGGDYVGGIVGKGSNIADCCSIPNINDALNFKGAIAGDVCEDGLVRNNYFVHEELAGIDRVSYSKKAQPISYEDMLESPNLPEDFSKITISYVIEDEDGDSDIIIAEKTYKYGESIGEDIYPDVPAKDGYYAKWDVENVEMLTSDMEIKAEYIHEYTTLASNAVLENGQSAVLVDGHFKENDVFEAYINPTAEDTMDQCLEYWELTIPDDGSNTHMIRYTPANITGENTDEEFDIYLMKNDEWVKAETEKMGNYITFNIEGLNTGFQVIGREKGFSAMMWLILGGLTCLLAGVAVIMIRHKVKTR